MRSKVEKRAGRYFVYHMGALMNKVNHMKAGECFGELALLSDKENEPRMATVLCTENCEFAVLDRQSFKVTTADRGHSWRDPRSRVCEASERA